MIIIMSSQKIQSTVLENIQIIEFESQEELNRHFFRLSAYYESHNNSLLHKKFTVNEFFKKDLRITDNKFKWKTRVLGFNIPQEYVVKFFQEYSENELTKTEKVIKSLYKENCYLIGVFNVHNKNFITLSHEYVHALFHNHEEYRQSVINHLLSDKWKHITNYIVSYIKEKELLYVCEENYLDEINAYACTQPIIPGSFGSIPFSMEEYDEYCNQCFYLQSPLMNNDDFVKYYLDLKIKNVQFF